MHITHINIIENCDYKQKPREVKDGKDKDIRKTNWVNK